MLLRKQPTFQMRQKNAIERALLLPNIFSYWINQQQQQKRENKATVTVSLAQLKCVTESKIQSDRNTASDFAMMTSSTVCFAHIEWPVVFFLCGHDFGLK